MQLSATQSTLRADRNAIQHWQLQLVGTRDCKRTQENSADFCLRCLLRDHHGLAKTQPAQQPSSSEGVKGKRGGWGKGATGTPQTNLPTSTDAWLRGSQKVEHLKCQTSCNSLRLAKLLPMPFINSACYMQNGHAASCQPLLGQLVKTQVTQRSTRQCIWKGRA